MQLSAADSRKKKRRRRREVPLPAACSSRSAAGAAQGQCQCQCQCCCCSSPGGGGLVATTIPCAFFLCSTGASCAPAAAVRLGTQHQQHKLTMLLLALALLLVLPPPPAPFLVAGVSVSVSPRRMARIQSHLDRINKAPVRSIRVRRTRRRINNDPSMQQQPCVCSCVSVG
jgi:hypothetical protein